MAAEQSILSKYPLNFLVNFTKKLLDKGFDKELYNHYETNRKHLASMMKYLDAKPADLDLQFMAEFIDSNENILDEIFETNDKTLIPKLIIPQAQEYRIEYTLDGSCSFTELYHDKISCYSQWWVEDSLNEQRMLGEWEDYNGTLIRTDYDNYETSDFTFEKYSLLGESSKKSILDKLVLENTAEVISSLDTHTLIELKKIIDSRLSSL